MASSVASGQPIRIHRAMRLLLLLCGLIGMARAAPTPGVPGIAAPGLVEALKHFRPDAPRGWSFTQTTEAEGKSTVERCDAAKPEFDRWSLLQKDGRAPTAADTKDYAEGRSRRSRGGTAPQLIEQLDLATIEVMAETTERATYRCRLKPGDPGDTVAGFLRATIVLHQPTPCIESLTLGSASGFSPTFGVKITEMTTVMTYHLPHGDRPSLPQKVSTRVRGRAFVFKSLDAEMTVTFSDYVQAGKK